MSTAATARTGRSVAVTALGLVTLLAGTAYAALGVSLVFAGADMVEHFSGDPAGGLGPVLQILGGLMTMIGVALLFQGVPGVLAGVGVLLRRQWGRVLTFALAALAALWGLAFLGFSDGDATLIALGAAQILYGILALVVLIKGGAEFSRPR